eukprot:CAMPEP_0176497660 /NCGR_PEP_ID=MMETSP0200_2-20121128/11850_1 /TAXON_ID=947934 /ORGANISM="Chaetoceros sp., Strain GSL56" /LENGTH=1349 /DNA_ID=CAMNT_0017895703 /DNA_START=42 /DNA_END=4088 /DNA_ORIENTATION=-
MNSVVKQEEEQQQEESIIETPRRITGTESSSSCIKDEETTHSNPDLLLSIKEDDDEQNDDEQDSDSIDEDEEFYKPPEPLYDKASSLDFRQLCQRFETLWKQKSKKKKPSKDEILDFLLPKSLQKFISCSNGDLRQNHQEVVDRDDHHDAATMTTNQQQSIFPLLRLMCPDKDTTRPRLYMKEAVIAKTWAEALGLSSKGSDYNKLIHHNDPIVAGMSAAGDISMCIYEVMKKRYPEFNDKHGERGVTVKKMNDLLDELAGIRNMDQEEQGPGVAKGGSHGLQTKRKAWVKKLINMKFSPIEHKWIVRIILGKLELGVGSDRIINYYHPYAEAIYAANKNLKTLCSTLCDKEFLRKRKQKIQEEIAAVDDVNRSLHLPKNSEPAVLNHTISPMLSLRTGFESILSDLQVRHGSYAELLNKDNPLKTCLALKFPAFTCEVKLDGERLLAHMHKGIVKVQTRRGNWYSQLYSPVLGPFIREAVGNFDVDIILDGEVTAWDDKKKVTLPFGCNRRVAKLRKEWLHRNRELDERDLNLHDGEEDVNVVSDSFQDQENLGFETNQNSGSHVWMKYVIFDILFLGGPDAQKVMEKAFGYLPASHRPMATGSVLQLDLMKRKRILYTLLKTQKNRLEHVETLVIRSDGNTVEGNIYFSSPESLEYGHPPLILDSINATLDGLVSNITDIDFKRRNMRTDEDIDKERALALDKFYADVVTRRNLEGLIFKDLASPYCFGAKYRKLGYWYKLKDDYSQSGHAADIDVVVVGASFASGTRNSKYLNSFLIACVDDESDPTEGTKYMTLGSCNGNVIGDKNLRKLLEKTGYKVNVVTEEIDYGSWFKSMDNPPFISSLTYQFSSVATVGGWKPEKKDKPDLWINPEDSFVLTTFAGEIVATKHFSAGVSLRFPRISAIRKEGFDNEPKAACDVETVSTLHELYYTRRAQQVDSEKESQIFKDADSVEEYQRLFRPTTENLKKRKISRKRVLSNDPNVRGPKVRHDIVFQSDCLKNLCFTVLDGVYKLDTSGLDCQIAKSEGWFESAKFVRHQQDVVNFILKHGGQCHLTANESTNFIIGGDANDPRVAMFCKSIDSAYANDMAGKRNKEHLRKMIEFGGVLKWTFLFATVHRMRSTSNQISLLPKRHDYLAMSKFAEKRLLESEDIYGLHQEGDIKLLEFKRVLLEVERQVEATHEEKLSKCSVETNVVQYPQSILSQDEKKTLRTPLQNRFIESVPIYRKMLLYPDLFEINTFDVGPENDTEIENDRMIDSDLGDSSVASSFLLFQATGIETTCRLTNNATHILCNIIPDVVRWDQNIPISVFSDVDRGKKLMNRLTAMKNETEVPLFLVSPEWVKKLW